MKTRFFTAAFRPAIVGLVFAAGCVTVPVEDMELVTLILTTGGSGDTFDRTPQQGAFGIGDRIHACVTLRWPEAGSNAGMHKRTQKWYTGDRLVAKTESKVAFTSSPFELRASILASSFGPGHHRVEVYIDDTLFASGEFDVEQ